MTHTHTHTGENNILSIGPSDSTLLNNLTSVQISLYYDKSEQPAKPVTFSLNLRKITNDDDGEQTLYVTQPFQPPRQPFKIDVNNKYNFEPYQLV